MKTALDPRHKKRQKTVQVLFSWSFVDQKIEDKQAEKIIENHSQIDKIIVKVAPEWEIDKIARVDLAILRLAIYELLKSKEPEKVVIDEAIELAKEIGGENSASFVNGALGKALKLIKGKNEKIG